MQFCIKDGCANLCQPIRPGVPTVCIRCCEAELGETLHDIQVRTSNGWTRKQYARKLDEQEEAERRYRAHNSPY